MGVTGQLVLTSQPQVNSAEAACAPIVRDFDLTETAVGYWVKQAEVDAGEREGLTGSEREEPAALRRENRWVREDVDVLKRATALFAKETR